MILETQFLKLWIKVLQTLKLFEGVGGKRYEQIKRASERCRRRTE